jgi:hypothetical protein
LRALSLAVLSGKHRRAKFCGSKFFEEGEKVKRGRGRMRSTATLVIELKIRSSVHVVFDEGREAACPSSSLFALSLFPFFFFPFSPFPFNLHAWRET